MLKNVALWEIAVNIGVGNKKIQKRPECLILLGVKMHGVVQSGVVVLILEWLSYLGLQMEAFLILCIFFY
jgi:hypothetical protein